MDEKPAPPPLEDEFAGWLATRVRADEASAPAFSRLLERPRGLDRSRGSARRLRGLSALAAAVAFLGLSAAFLFSRRAPSRAPARSVSLETWKAPSDSVGVPYGAELLTSTPSILEPVPDYSHLERALEEKGDRS